MISVAEADKIILQNCLPFPSAKKPLNESYGAVLRENITADRDLPSFDKALMDGIAINTASYQQGNRQFSIEGIQAAGKEALQLKSDISCTEIMTGAVLSIGADCVVPIEHVQIKEKTAVVEDSASVELMKNISKQGSDYQKGTELIKAGCILDPPQIATAASVGKATINVSTKPNVAIISTGDELVDINEPLEPFQIRKSNSYFIHAALTKTFLFEASMFHFPDDKKILLKQISALLETADALILTGGVSMGKFDYIPEVLKELNIEVLFHKVKQKPGKPFWFGKSNKNQPVFALPGNPVSTQIGTYRHVLPNLKHALGIQEPVKKAVLQTAVTLNTKFTFFLPVKLCYDQDGQYQALPVNMNGSGDFASIAQSNGFMEIPEGMITVPKEFVGTIYEW